MGITLASFPHETTQHGGSAKHEFRLYDEGLPILTLYATRRHFKLQPIAFRNALAQSVRVLLESSSAAEVERVKATLDRSSVVVDSLCQGESLMHFGQLIVTFLTHLTKHSTRLLKLVPKFSRRCSEMRIRLRFRERRMRRRHWK
mgnify:CR=1 FL=1